MQVQQEYIQISTDIRDGKPRIANTRITVEDIAIWHLKQGYSLIEIAGKYNLSIASVYAAMAYYFDHRDDIDRQTAEEDKQIEALKQASPSRLQEKLKRFRNDATNSLSS